MTAAAPPLAPDLTDGLRRLKLAAMRRLAPELLLTAKTQRWAPEELLRTLVEAELSARDASNARTRLKNAAFPVTKTLDEFDLGVSSVPQPTVAYLASLEWITAAENLCLVGPAGTGTSPRIRSRRSRSHRRQHCRHRLRALPHLARDRCARRAARDHHGWGPDTRR